MSAALLDEDVYGNHHSHKRQIKPPEKDVGGCVGLRYQFSSATNLILRGLVSHCGASKIYHNPTKGSRGEKKESEITLQS